MDFVTFEIAKKLKEKGFREKCFATYSSYGGIFKFNEIDTDKIARCDLNIKDFGKCYNCYEKGSNIDAPTISQVLKWLRETKNIEVVASFDYEDKTWGYQVGDMTLTEDSILAYRWNFPTYEQAALTGIEYVLDNLI